MAIYNIQYLLITKHLRTYAFKLLLLRLHSCSSAHLDPAMQTRAILSQLRVLYNFQHCDFVDGVGALPRGLEKL